MKKIGLIGGMSWESTQVYYRLINEMVRTTLGGHHSSRSIIESVNFAEIEKLQHQNDWPGLCNKMRLAAQNLESAGADCILLCTNTMHLCSTAITEAVNIPFIHIAEATADKIAEKELSKVLLLGTRFTMESDSYQNICSKRYGLDISVPNKADREIVHRIIYEELVFGVIKRESKKAYLNIIDKAKEKGVEGVILGCTEIPLLIKQKDTSLSVFDTTYIHAERAVKFSLE